MDLPETSINKKTFIGHVFSTTEEGKAELLNIVQYSLMGIIPIIILNKIIQQFVPEACDDKSSVELVIEIFIQIIVMFCGIIFIHRIITYFPTYSGFKYDNLVLTNVVLAFLIIVLSLQTKLGIKVNIIYDRVLELWNGTPSINKKDYIKNNLKLNNTHVPSQADYLDGGSLPSLQSEPSTPPQQQPQQQQSFVSELMPANSLLGSSFGSW
jgi:hypothetical protein